MAESAFARFSGWRCVQLMLRHGFIASLLFVVSFVFFVTASAQTSSVEGNVVGADGRPPENTEIRFEQKESQVSPIIGSTNANGHYTAALPRGVYKLTLATVGKVRASITVRANLKVPTERPTGFAYDRRTGYTALEKPLLMTTTS